MMEKKHTDEKNYLSVRIKWCALLAAGLVGAFLVRMWVVCIREMQSLMVPAVFTALSAALAVIVYRTVLIPYRETRKIYEQFVMGYVMEDLFKVRYPFSPESEQAVLRLNEIIDRNNLIAISKKQAEYLALQNHLLAEGVEMRFDTECVDLLIENSVCRGVKVRAATACASSAASSKEGSISPIRTPAR